MDEFAGARAALVTLEKRKQGLIAELNDVHAAIRSQRNKVEELIRRLPISPINRLPDEILLRIFELILGAARTEDKNCCVRWKGQLAEVSRRWRNVILHSPCLWTTITVSSSRSTALIETYIMRSSESPLDIEIHHNGILFAFEDKPLVQRLELVVTCAERWRSLTIFLDAHSTFRVLQRLGHLSLPSLTSVCIRNFPCCEPEKLDPPFLRSQCAPRMEKIFISGDIGMLKGREIPSSVKTLAVELDFFSRSGINSALLLESMPCQRLTSLCLDGRINFGELSPNSIQLPLLEKLKHFEGHAFSANQSLHDTFVVVSGKFSSVDHFTLYESQRHETVSKSLCLAFPGVRHLVLPKEDIIAVLRSAEGPGTAFHWQHLESLTSIGHLEKEFEAFINDLANCLRRRQEAGLSKFRLNLSTPFSVEKLLFVYEQLNDVCILECAYNTHDTTLPGMTSGKLWLENNTLLFLTFCD